MAACFHLVPRDLCHKSWQYSKTTKAVFIIANDEPEARRRVANTLCNGVMPPPGPRYSKIMYPPSPWEIHEATSCKADTSGLPRDGLHVVADDGEKWPIKY
jgi:hypothetical protein